MISPAFFERSYSIAQHEQNKFEGMRRRAADLRNQASALSGLELKLRASRENLDNREIELNAKAEALRRLERKLAKRERALDDRDVEPIEITLPVAQRPRSETVVSIDSFAERLPPTLAHDFRPGFDLKTAADHAAWQQALQILLTSKKWNGEIPHSALPFEPAFELQTRADRESWQQALAVLECGRKWSTPDAPPDRFAVAKQALALAHAPTPSSPPTRKMTAQAVIETARKWCGANSRFVS